MKHFATARRHFLLAAGSALTAAIIAPVTTRAADRKVLVAVIGEDPPTLNPATAAVISCVEAAAPVYSGLLNMAADGSLSPGLAESWRVSPDNQTFSFKLRQGVTWHDGQPFSAADVKFTIEEMIARIHPIGRSIYQFLSHVETPDETTAVIRLTRSYAPLLSCAFGFWPMLPRHLWAGTDFLSNPHTKRPVGTGAYKFASYDPGDRIRYVRYEHYFEKGLPLFDEVVLRIIPDASARALAFENDEADILHSSAVPVPDLPRLTRLPDTRLHLSRQLGVAVLATLNLRTPALKDRRVRQALAHTIDRKFLRQNVLPVISEEMIGPLWPASPLYDHSLTDYALDPSRANQLLDQAGFPRAADGTRLTLRLAWAAGDIRLARIADVMARNLAGIGIRLTLQPLERATLIQRAYVAGENDIVIEFYSLGPDPDFGTERLYNSANIKAAPSANTSHYSNPEVDRLFDAQRGEGDPAKRREAYARIQQIIWSDVPVIPLAAVAMPSLSNARFVTNLFDHNWIAQADGLVRARPGNG